MKGTPNYNKGDKVRDLVHDVDGVVVAVVDETTTHPVLYVVEHEVEDKTGKMRKYRYNLTDEQVEEA